jgi:PAT family beta-lactamase induction signal transducer AmpG
VSVADTAALSAMTLAPQTYKFLWAPLTDALFTRKRWYFAATAACSITVALMGLVPIQNATLGLWKVIVFLNSLAATFVGMSVEAIMAHATPDTERGRAGGWSQAGNLGGSGLGGGLMLWLLLHMPSPWMATTLLGLLLFACTAALRRVPEPSRNELPLGKQMRQIVVDLFEVVWSRNGAIAVALCFLPMGAGAAANIFSSVAKEWRASAEMVEGLNGGLSGVVMIFGCLAGGRISDALNRKGAYALVGGILALFACAMAFVPQSPLSYGVLCVGYQFLAGACYGAFTGFVLEIIGAGAAATKYNTFASLSNIPIWYMTLVDGSAADKMGAAKMLLVDAAAGAIGIAVLFAVVALVATRRPAPTPRAV